MTLDMQTDSRLAQARHVALLSVLVTGSFAFVGLVFGIVYFLLGGAGVGV